MMNLLEQLNTEYGKAGFDETETADSLIFSKTYPFDDCDGQKKDLLIEVRFSKEYPVLPPQLHDPGKVLSSMHSLNGFQCWARYSDIFPQVGLGLITPDVIETQIQKLIKAHKSREYYTVNESPEFASIFEARKAVDHSQFYVSCDVLDEAVTAGPGRFISSVADKFGNNLYGVNQAPSVSSHIFPAPRNNTGKRRVFFLNVPIVQHYDYRIDDINFLYSLELLSGIAQENAFLQSIEDRIFYVVVVFFNKGLNHHDVVVFSKQDNKLLLFPHARVSSRNVLFSRHAKEFEQLAGKKVALIGIGAIGSMLGMNLLHSGIDLLHVVDNDYVDLENMSRYSGPRFQDNSLRW
jgi:ThiF family